MDKAVVFLYTVSPGPCSKSHGFNAARLAGLPGAIIDRALKVAAQFEEEQNNLLELARIVNAQ
jgi:DNA mismatch repair ATPase MutS